MALSPKANTRLNLQYKIFEINTFSLSTNWNINKAVSGDVTWDSYDTVYVTGDITIGNGASLTIEPNTNGSNAGSNDNVYIVFRGNYGITISSDGTFNTSGTSSDSIVFTADRDKNHVFGESVETWAHISFENTSATDSSIIDYSVFEYGYVKDLSGTSGYGSALHINIDKVRVSNSYFSDNTAEWGGAIFVNKNKGPLIKVCVFYTNESDNGGGGIYCWDGADAVIENCIFEQNKAGYGTSNSIYTGGGVSLQTSTDVKLLNCTFVNNDSNHDGDGLQLYGWSGNQNATNCILWGSNSQVVGGSSSELTNCAIQGSTTGTNTINLNSSNTGTNPYGPFFKATDGTDWSIEVISPCRDAGTTPSPTVPNDYDGNSRVDDYDIGAYEVQYNRWKTNGSDDDWTNGNNWTDGTPSGGSENIIIPTDADYYPTSSSSLYYSIGNNYGMVLEPGSKATFGTLATETNGDLKLEANVSDTASLIVNSADTYAYVEYYLKGGEASTDKYRWHYISSPYSDTISITPFTDATLNLAQFNESLYSESNGGWVAYDGYVYETGVSDGATFDTLISGKGYNFYDNVNNKITLSNSNDLEYDDVTVDLTFGDNGDSLSGFNLLGNPFSSGLDWDKIVDSSYYSYPGSTSTGLYFTRDDEQCSYVAGVGDPSDVTVIIPPTQGFFVKTNSNGNSITLPAAARTHDNIHARYKKKSMIPLVRLSISQFISSATIGPPSEEKDSLINDETVVRFDEQAKSGLDLNFDAVKMFLSDDELSIYSHTGEAKYAINGIPFPETTTEIPLAVTVLEEGSTHITISTTQIQELHNYNIILKDLETGFDVDLRAMDMVFTASPGTHTDRFVLAITKQTTGLPDITESDKPFNISSNNEMLFIKPLKNDWNGRRSELRIFDITGKMMKHHQDIEWQKGITNQFSLNVPQRVYLVVITSPGEKFVGRVSVIK